MKNLGKQLFSLILPITVLIIIPLLIERNVTIASTIALTAGIAIMCAGLYIMIRTITAFIKIGKGTLAPWSPTKKLVITGMYRYTRNPMILGVLTVLLGEALTILSWKIFITAIVFFIVNTLWFMVYEEPDLEKKFGDEYKEYKKNVSRWLPRRSPFEPSQNKLY
jgi:protein-S-isoprenylcysteine O-methyltransferase Ste14